MAKKTRFAARWRIDYDYLEELTDEERAWLNQFTDEFYRATFGPNPLHGKALRRDVYDAQNSANRDIVTASGTKVLDQLQRIQSAKDDHRLSRRYYGPNDYPDKVQPPSGCDVIEISSQAPIHLKKQA